MTVDPHTQRRQDLVAQLSVADVHFLLNRYGDNMNTMPLAYIEAFIRGNESPAAGSGEAPLIQNIEFAEQTEGPAGDITWTVRVENELELGRDL
jgi:hypothetical protein